MLRKHSLNTTLTQPYKNGRCSVIIRVSCSGRIELYTGISIKKSEWNNSRQRVKQGVKVDGIDYNILNKELNEMEEFISDYFQKCAERDTNASLSDLKERFNYKFKSSSKSKANEFFFMYDRFIKEEGSKNGWQENMIGVQKRLKEKIRVFKPQISFPDLSTTTLEALKVHLSKELFNDTLIKNLSYLKQFAKWALSKKCPVNDDVFSYNPKLPKSKKAVKYLTLGELETIYNLDLSQREGLDRTRDVFVFQCYTALRYSDVSQLKRENITKKDNGDYYIDILTEKDDDRIVFKLAQRAVKIYVKYEDNVYENDLVFPIISSQKFNENLKEIGKLADLKGEWIDYQYRLDKKVEIKKPKHELEDHTARRTFIITAMNEGISLDNIALITSHSDVNAMKPYIKLNTKGTDIVIDAINRAKPAETK